MPSCGRSGPRAAGDLGGYKNKQSVGISITKGQRWRPKADPEKVRVQDFGKDHVRPYGIWPHHNKALVGAENPFDS
jgi:hypothetical protein